MSVDYQKRNLWKKAVAFLMTSILIVGTVSVPASGNVEGQIPVKETPPAKTLKSETGTFAEVQSPVLMSESSVSMTKATAGDEITYRIKIDGEVVDENVRMSVWYPESGNLQDLYMESAGDGVYTAQLTVKPYEGNGTLCVFEIGVWNGNQYEFYYNTKVAEESETQRINLDKLDVELSGCGLDVEAPAIDWEECIITPEVLDGPGTVTLSLPMSDDKSGIPEQCGEIYFSNEESGQTVYFDMNYDADTGLAVGVSKFSIYGANGTWVLDYINIYDNAENYADRPEKILSFQTKNLEEDFEPPVVDLKNIRMEPAELRPYEPVTITIPVEDKSGIQAADCYIGLEGVTESAYYVEVRYDEAKKAIVGEFSLDRDYGKNNQKYVLKNLWCKDAAENDVWYFDSELAECPAFVTTQGFIEDSVGPEIDLSTLKIDPVHVTPNTNQEIRVKITDLCGEGEEISGVDHGECLIECPDGSEMTTSLWKSWEETDIYYINQSYTSYGVNGRFVIKKITAYDNAGNTTEVSPKNVYYEVEGLEEDTEAPKVDIKTLKVTPEEAGPYSQIQVEVKATDNKEIDYSSVQFQQPDGTIQSYELQYDSAAQLMKATILLGDYAKNGTWTLYSIEISDEAGNTTYYGKEELEKEYTVVVSGMKEDGTAPFVDLSQIKFSADTIHPGDTLKIEMPVVEESDISYAYVRMTSVEGGKDCSINLYPVGAGKNKVLVGTKNFNDTNITEDGRWTVSEICVSDIRGNVYQGSLEEAFVTFEGFGQASGETKILYEQMAVNKTVVKPGDVIRVTIPVENVNMISGSCNFKSRDDKILSVRLLLNEDKTAVSGEIEMRGNCGYNTTWELQSVYLYDGISNTDKKPEKKVSFTTEGFREKEDELDYAGITVTPEKIQKKQKVMVRIPLKNPDNVGNSGGIRIATEGNLDTKYAFLKKNNNVLEGAFEFNGYEANTKWKITDLSYYILVMGGSDYYNVDLNTHPELENIVLTTENMTTDRTEPVLQSGSIQLESKTPVPGGEAKLTLKASDNLSGVSEVTVSYSHIGSTMAYTMEKVGKDLYGLTIPLSEYGYDGAYRLSSVTICDEAGNRVSYEKNNYDLSSGDFEVSNFKPDYEAPLFDRAGWKMDKRVFDSNEKIKFSIPVSDRESGISSVKCRLTIGSGGYERNVEMQYDKKTGIATGIIDDLWGLAGEDLLNDEESVKCVIEHITAFDKAGNSSGVNVQTLFTVNRQESLELPFDDVSESDWFAGEVRYAYEKKLMTGLDEKTFAPYDILSRAQFAVILYRMAGSPSVEFDAKRFPDVEKGWYSDAVIWANDHKIITGYTYNGCFGPVDIITREQLATMMYRYAKVMNYDVSISADFDGFADAYKVSGFAEEAMRWAVGNSIITGRYEGTALDPQGEASRAECATILHRFLEM